MAALSFPAPFRQKADWDCGVACAASAASFVLGRPAEAMYASLRAHLPLTSVWTVELALALLAEGLPRPVFFSRLLGVNAAHAELSFYVSLLPSERPRVAALFERAAARGLEMVERRLSLDWICDRLARRACLYLALVDLRRIACARCLIGVGAFQFVFAGHYILLVSYDYATDRVAYMDPNAAHSASAEFGPFCVMSAADMQAARLAVGTDEDVIEIPLLPTGSAAASTERAGGDAALAAAACGGGGGGAAEAAASAEFASAPSIVTTPSGAQPGAALEGDAAS